MYRGSETHFQVTEKLNCSVIRGLTCFDRSDNFFSNKFKIKGNANGRRSLRIYFFEIRSDKLCKCAAQQLILTYAHTCLLCYVNLHSVFVILMRLSRHPYFVKGRLTYIILLSSYFQNIQDRIFCTKSFIRPSQTMKCITFNSHTCICFLSDVSFVDSSPFLAHMIILKREIFGDYCRSGNFRVFKFARIFYFGPFHEVENSKFSFFFTSAIIIIIFAKFLNSRICPPREIGKNFVKRPKIKNSRKFKHAKITRSTVISEYFPL